MTSHLEVNTHLKMAVAIVSARDPNEITIIDRHARQTNSVMFVLNINGSCSTSNPMFISEVRRLVQWHAKRRGRQSVGQPSAIVRMVNSDDGLVRPCVPSFVTLFLCVNVCVGNRASLFFF